VAGEAGALVDHLKSFGGEWLPFVNATWNPSRLRRNSEALDKFIAQERVDIVHAKSPGAAWSALVATDRNSTWLVTNLPDLTPKQAWLSSLYLGSLARGDRVIARSMFNAQPMIDRHRIPLDRVVVIPRAIDMQKFDPKTVTPQRIAALRQHWGIPSGVRIVLTPGRVAPWNGQITLVETARVLMQNRMRGVTFVLAGDDLRHRRYVRALRKHAQAEGVDSLFRIVGPCPDMAAAYAASDLVVAPNEAPPLHGRVVAEAQAMARPVVTTNIGALPEHLIAPPRMPEDLRTGWIVNPGDPIDLARAISSALALDAAAYRALAVRARQFAEYMFSPRRVAAATLDVYSSLLEAEA
jgi:glycosyltransferase involved in cell wall biosynthesis